MKLRHHRPNPSLKARLRASGAVALAFAVALILTLQLGATPAAQARLARASEFVPTSQVKVTGAVLRTVPPSFLGLSMNVEEMEDFTNQPAFPQFVKLITPNGDGPFVLRLGGTFADSAYWNGETSQIMAPYLAPPSERVTIDEAWLQSLRDVLVATGSHAIINVNAADHDPQMALNFVE